MNEWGVVGVLVVLIGLVATLVKPLDKMECVIDGKHNGEQKALTKTIKDNETRNEKRAR